MYFSIPFLIRWESATLGMRRTRSAFGPPWTITIFGIVPAMYVPFRETRRASSTPSAPSISCRIASIAAVSAIVEAPGSASLEGSGLRDARIKPLRRKFRQGDSSQAAEEVVHRLRGIDRARGRVDARHRLLVRHPGPGDAQS